MGKAALMFLVMLAPQKFHWISDIEEDKGRI